jgi:predicted AlkP superfamily pyrophosphatase or phosphodiesterase
MENGEIRLCCERFRECVKLGEIIHSDEYDETEWYIPRWHHIYFCPFCGKSVKGQGFGHITQPID